MHRLLLARPHAFTTTLLLIVSLEFGYAQSDDDVPISWEPGPFVAQLGELAEIKVPRGYYFTGKQGTQTFLELHEVIPSGTELGAIVPEELLDGDQINQWSMMFGFTNTGYIRDDEKDDLDPDEILKLLREQNQTANAEKRKRGWQELHIAGWHKPPHYDTRTNNLTWAIRVKTIGYDDELINYSTRLLGRTGVMHVALFAEEFEYRWATHQLDSILDTFNYLEGNSYSNFVEGDKLASYGLTALIVGVAAKTGLFKKLWKLVAIAFIAVLAALKGLIGKIAGRRNKTSHSLSQ